MNERSCIRCQHPVLLESGHLVYCSHCGAPQIFLSEELQGELAAGVLAYEQRGQTAEASRAEEVSPARFGPFRKRGTEESMPAEMAWRVAMRYALLSAAVALALGLLSLLLPPVGLLTIVWVITAPMLTVAAFQARSGGMGASPMVFGARLGLLTGALLAVCCAGVFALSLVLTRFVFHDASALDAQLANTFVQQRTLMTQRFGADAGPTMDLLNRPEFRVGLLLFVLGTSGTLYLALATVAGGVAGALFQRRRLS